MFVNYDPGKSISDKSQQPQATERRSYAASIGHERRKQRRLNRPSSNKARQGNWEPTTSLHQEIAQPCLGPNQPGDRQSHHVLSIPSAGDRFSRTANLHTPHDSEQGSGYDWQDAAALTDVKSPRYIVHAGQPPGLVRHLVREDARFYITPWQSPLSSFLSETDANSVRFCFERCWPDTPKLYHGSFWSDLLARLTLGNEGLQYAVSSLGSLLRSFGGPEEAAALKTRSLTTCSKALQSLMLDRQSSPIVLLAACLIFVILEFVAKAPSRAMHHFRGGAAILTECQSRRKHSGPASAIDSLIDHVVLPVYERMSIRLGEHQLVKVVQYAVHVTNPLTEREPFGRIPFAFSDKIETSVRVLQVNVPNQFDSFRMSDCYLQRIKQWITSQIQYTRRQSTSNEEETTNLSSRSTQLLLSWKLGFNQLLSSHPAQLESNHRLSLSIIDQEVQYLFLYIFASTQHSKDEMRFDDYDTCFQRIVELCDQLRGLKHIQETGVATAATFQMNASLLPAILFTAVRCRNYLIRREALILLEHIYQSAIESTIAHPNLAFWARRTMEIEEGADDFSQESGRIPKERRIRCLDLSYDPGTRIG